MTPNPEDLVVIVIEVSSPKALHFFSYGRRYGDDSHQFYFKEFSPIRLEKYPSGYFFYALYSQSKLEELYRKVDMAHRIEPVDNLMWARDGAPYRTFRTSNLEMMTRLGKFEIVPISEVPREGTLGLTDTYHYVIDEIFGETSQGVEKKNYIIEFPNQNSALGGLRMLLETLKVSKDTVRFGTMQGCGWLLSVTLTADEMSKLDEAYDDYDLRLTEHSVEIPAESLGFYETENAHVSSLKEKIGS